MSQASTGDDTSAPMADGDDGDSGGSMEKSLQEGTPTPSIGEHCQLQTGKDTTFLICNDICLVTPGRPIEEMTDDNGGVTTHCNTDRPPAGCQKGSKGPANGGTPSPPD